MKNKLSTFKKILALALMLFILINAAEFVFAETTMLKLDLLNQDNIEMRNSHIKLKILTQGKANKITMLLYHHILKKNEIDNYGWTGNDSILSLENFREQMNYLYQNDFYTLTLAELEEFLYKGIELPKKAILITFDDGYLSNAKYAYPVMKEFGFKGSIFLIGSTSEKEPMEFTPEKIVHLSNKEIQKYADVFEYGSHTYSMHSIIKGQNLLIISPIDKVAEDLRINKILYRTSYIAYPYGQYNERWIGLLIKENCKLGFTTKPGYVNKKSKVFELNRFVIYPKTSIKRFEEIVNGNNYKKYENMRNNHNPPFTFNLIGYWVFYIYIWLGKENFKGGSLMKKFISILLLFTIIVSVSTYATADQTFTVKNSVIKDNEELLSINVATPYFEGFQSADEINQLIRSLIVDSIGDARLNKKNNKQLYEELVKKGEKPATLNTTLDTYYDYSTNRNILSIYLHTYYYSGGAHPTNWVNSFSINTSTGEIYSFKDLFLENVNVTSVFEDKILAKIEENPESYFEGYKKTIKDKNGNFNFYFNGDELVIYFDLYELVPYVYGITYFKFKANDIKDLLKTEILDSLNQAKLNNGPIYLNGKDLNSKSSPYIDNDIIMIPLRVVAEALDYNVAWNKKDGAIVAGGFIKNGVDSYFSSSKKPVIIAKAIVKNGITFVPIQYFTEVLEENVSYGDNNTIMIFSKNELDYGFNDLVVKFENPDSLKSAAEMFANSVKERNGAVQFGLMDKDNRKANYSNFNELNFVTGVSSPWIDSFEILPTKDSAFKITFHLKTSEPKDVLTMTTDIKFIEDANTFRIQGLVNSNN